MSTILDIVSEKWSSRLMELFKHLGTETKGTFVSQRARCMLSEEDIDLLSTHGIIEESKILNSTFGEIIPFTVLESKKGTWRRRFIAWPKSSNEAVKGAGYVADLPRKHVSFYLEEVLKQSAFITDLTTSFFQVALPENIKYLFTFVAANGKRFQLNRLPMGHVVSPEIIQICTSAISGHHDYVRSPIIPKGNTVDIWIDNIRYTGTKLDVQKCKSHFLQQAMEVNVTFNSEETYERTDYDFIGVHFQHYDRAVNVKLSTLSKIVPPSLEMTIAELETLFSQLTFASSILGIKIVNYYWALKLIRRRLSHLAKHAGSIDKKVNLPPSAYQQLVLWTSLVLKNNPRVVRPFPDSCHLILYTDASTAGWGGVLINNNTQEVWSFGNAWKENETPQHINVLEAQAVLFSLINNTDRIPDASALTVKIDNTTAEGTIRKGYGNSLELNVIVDNIDKWKTKKNVELVLEHVSSKNNLADGPSRGLSVSKHPTWFHSNFQNLSENLNCPQP